METLEAMRIQLDGIGHVLSDNKLSVPRYQRSYAWEEKHVIDLLQDINTAIQHNENEYFLGSIVITGTTKELLQVVDGQQRLATTIILLAAIRDYFYINGDPHRAEDISRSYLMNRDLRSQETLPRLHLNEVDHNYFLKRVLPLPDDQGRSTVSATKDSHKHIDQAAQLITQYISKLASIARNPTEALLQWVEYLHTRAKVIYVTVPDHANAFTIFETLNDRGLDLAISDLLKNHLFSLAGDRIGEVQQYWLSMIGVLETTDSRTTVVTYIRHLWSSKEGLTREKDLYSSIKKRVNNKQSAINFSEELYENAKLYAAILNANHDLWDKFGPTAKDHMDTLNLLGMIQMRPLVLSVLDKLSIQEVQKSLRVMVSWAVRYLIVGGGGTGTTENYYSLRAVDIRNGSVKTAKELADIMQTVVPSDAEFIRAFEGAVVNKSNVARYYLRVLEKQLRNEQEPALVPNSNQEQVNLEHILPQNPSKAWGHIDSETADAYYNKIGNLTLLPKKQNVGVGNNSFAEKCKIYKNSSFIITSSLDIYSTWGLDEIERRQRELASLATQAWSIKA